MAADMMRAALMNVRIEMNTAGMQSRLPCDAMLKLLLVGIGGFVGAVSRYTASGLVYRWVDAPALPYGTLVVNIVGCFLIGFLGGLSDMRQLFTPETRLLVFVGFLGGFTTFSSFEFEVFTFVRDGQLSMALLNMFLHLILGFGAVWLGYTVTKSL
jgi:CrcB protein